ncbi:MAG: dihydrolipoyl dehydrogenase family protein, partial [Thermoplasmata archaeon]
MTEDLVVIGSGPGGYVAAVLASKEGLDVKVIEKGVTGGVCTNYGCIPSKALLSISGKIEDIKGAKRDGIDVSFEGVDFKKVMSKKERAVKMSRKGIEKLFDENGIELIEGEAKVVSEDEVEVNGERLKADNIIIATGSKPISLPDIEIDEEKILSNRGILDLDEAPETLLVIGGGYIGLEMAYVYSSLGSEVIIVELLDELLPNMDKDLSSVAEKMMKRKKVQFYTGSKVTEITEREEDLKVMIEGEEEKSLEVDKVLLSVGRKPTPPPSEIELTDDKGTIEIDEKMRTDFDGIYAIGDVNGESMLAHSAFKEAEIAVKDILGQETAGFDP